MNVDVRDLRIGRMRKAVLSLCAAVLAGAGVLAVVAPVRAECPYFVIPPATEAARSAREVIIGTVVENVRSSYFDFRLRIDHVLRGPGKVGEIRRFDSLWPGWPVIEMSDGTLLPPCEPIPGWKGNVIALSLDALAPDGRTRYNAASWLAGRLPFNRDLPRTTLAEMETLAALPQTDTIPPSGIGAAQAATPSIAIVVVGVGAASLLIFVGRRRRRPLG